MSQIVLRSLLYLLVTALVGGCETVGPDFETPESDVAEDWLETEDQRISSRAGDYDEWWKSFNDPVLESLIQQAAEQNKTLQIAGLRVFEARAILGIAAGSSYPQVQLAAGSVGRVELSENADPIANLPSPIRQSIDTSFGNYRLGFDAAWKLDFWGRY